MKVLVKVTQLIEFDSYEDAEQFKIGMDSPLTLEQSNEILKNASTCPIELKQMETEIVETAADIVRKKVMFGYGVF
jgi:hypothetical protein